MLEEIGYDREAAVDYALKWAYMRNPRFYDFEDIGGDCTNYVSQCLYAGCGVMNYSQTDGWYYVNINDRAPSWTGVIYLQRFLLTNMGAGVYGMTSPIEALVPGDVIQLQDSDGRFYHSLFVSYVIQPALPQNIFVCAHSYDARDRRLSTYGYYNALGIHILGARRETAEKNEEEADFNAVKF